MTGRNPPKMPYDYAAFQAAVEHWLDAVIKAKTNTYPRETHRESADSQLLNCAEMPTPPASGRSTSPSKRRRMATDPHDGTTSHPDAGNDDIERTPRSQRLPHRPFETPTVSASWSTTGSQLSTSSSKQRRSVSPVKKMQSLWTLEKSIKFVSMGNYPTEELPLDVQALHNRIRSITFLRSEFLPVEVREEITSDFGYTVPDFWFRPTSKDASNSQPSGERGRSDSALAELSTLRELLSTAQECEELGRSELAWNMALHYPLLKLALAGHRHVEQELVNTARIATPFIPPIGVYGSNPSVESRMVDFTLVFTPSPGRSRAKTRPQRQNPSEGENEDRDLAKVIDRLLLTLPPEEQSINQTLYTPLQKRPIAISIETKVNGSHEEGRIQLGIWASAWHRRMSSLMSLSDEGNQPSIIPLPLILVTEHQWQLMFACDRGDLLEVLEYIPICDTNTLLGLYTIVEALRELADWIEGPFWAWITDVFGRVCD